MRKERVIWSSLIDVDKWDFDREELEECGMLDADEELTDSKKYDIAYEINMLYLDDERANLNIELNNPILVIADLGLWNGRRSGYKIIHSGNIKDILHSNDDYIKWYSDGYNIKGVGYHHDGKNYYEYREIKDMDKIDVLLNKIYNQKKVTRADINRYTRSIERHVRELYGW